MHPHAKTATEQGQQLFRNREPYSFCRPWDVSRRSASGIFSSPGQPSQMRKVDRTNACNDALCSSTYAGIRNLKKRDRAPHSSEFSKGRVKISPTTATCTTKFATCDAQRTTTRRRSTSQPRKPWTTLRVHYILTGDGVNTNMAFAKKVLTYLRDHARRDSAAVKQLNALSATFNMA